MKILKLNSKSKGDVIKAAAAVLKKGGMIIYPTETCYGVGVDATNQEAVNRLLEYKTFRDDRPISVAVHDKAAAEKYVVLNRTAENLYKEYLPGPFTIVSKGKHKVAAGVESNLGTLGVRIPDHKFMLDLLGRFGSPVTATSANVSYKKTPYSVKDVLENTSDAQKDKIDLVIDAGELPHNDPSTVIDTTLDDVNVLRQGDIIIKEKQKLMTHSEEETRSFGAKLVEGLVKDAGPGKDMRPVIIAMQGELGTGKTQMCKGMAKTLGIKQEIISPTYTICREYKVDSGKTGKAFKMLYHIDTYKLMQAEEIDDIGFDDMLNRQNLLVIEWAEKISKKVKESSQKARIIWIDMFHKSENERIIQYGEYSAGKAGARRRGI